MSWNDQSPSTNGSLPTPPVEPSDHHEAVLKVADEALEQAQAAVVRARAKLQLANRRYEERRSGPDPH